MFDRRQLVRSVDMIIKEHHISSGVVIKPQFVRKQMHALGLKYAKVKHVLKNSNSPTNLVLR